MTWRLRSGLLVLPAALLACTLLTSFDEGLLAEASFERCRDRIDNDGDSLVDCDDPGCAAFSICNELSAAACRDGADNDADGLVDCQDPGCLTVADVCVEQTADACSDKIDNDGDQRIDCNDPDCAGLELCQEKQDPECSDGLDNDQDGFTDCLDFDCYLTSSCCKGAPVPLPSGSLAGDPACTPPSCRAGEACCSGEQERCNPFDPEQWVAWGLPRPRQQENAFVSNQPCGCRPSGLVSVERVPLQVGLELRFDLELPSGEESSICAGLTRSPVFPDEAPCAGGSGPRLLLGLCLRSNQAGGRQVIAVVDGIEEAERTLPHANPVSGNISVLPAGVELSGGPLQHRTTPIDPGLDRALILLQGMGSGGRISHLSLRAGTLPVPLLRRCQEPAAWYRHLGRGEAVIAAREPLVAASAPALTYLPEARGYLMVFAGSVAGSSRSSLYRASSPDGVRWEIRPQPIIPASSADLRFGSSQSDPSLLYREGVFHLWYTREEQNGSSVRRSIAHARSVDGLSWTPTGEGAGGEVLIPSPPPAWDSLEVSAPSVITGRDGSLLMFYTGLPMEMAPRPAIGVASSRDGLSWKRLQTQPIILPGNIQDLATESPGAIYDPDRQLYLLWYTHRLLGQAPVIRHAISHDGIHFSIFPTAVLEPGPLGSFDDRGVQDPSPLLLGGRLKLWFSGLGSGGALQIGFAENRGSF